MKARPAGFIADSELDHEGEILDYIQELHRYLWRVARAVNPGTSGCLDDFLDEAIEELEARMATARRRKAMIHKIKHALSEIKFALYVIALMLIVLWLGWHIGHDILGGMMFLKGLFG